MLVEAVLCDADFRRAFLEAPGGKLWHHASLGGLAEHTVKLAQVADAICPHYPALNRDLLVTGALLHDVGKVMEYTSDAAIEYSVEGRLMGHIVQGVLLVENKLAAIPDFPPETRRQVLHLILSHQGEPTMSSPVKPMTPEALVLHFLDEIDSKLDAFARVRAATPEGQDFSEYVKLMERFFYLKSIEPPIAEDP
jgi:3'-5' exoribonuclease